MKVIINASPQIFLARAGLLNILKELYGKVYTTTGILKEIEKPIELGISATEVQVIRDAKWIEAIELTEEEKNEAKKLTKKLNIGKGEAEAGVLYKRGYDLIIVADRRAERKLKGQKINVIDIVDVGFETASKEVVDLKNFAKAVWRAGYKTERIERILSFD